MPHPVFTIDLVEPFSWRSVLVAFRGEPASTQVLVGDAFRAAATVPQAAVPGVADAVITGARAAGALLRVSGSVSDPFIGLLTDAER
jgi:hypothetical protein